MKRISTLLLTGALVMGSLSAAHAMDVKVKGQWDFAFGMWENSSFTSSRNADRGYGNRPNDPFNARQRVRTQINFIASENLQGVLAFEIGNLPWGGHSKGTSGPGSGGALDGDGVNVETKRAYLDWMVPGTDLSIRMGLQGLSLPMATKYTNPVFSADVAAVVANYKINDMIGLTAFWARPFDAYENDAEVAGGRNLHDEVDLFGASLPVVGEGWRLTPWGMVGNIGASSGVYNYIQVAEPDASNAYKNSIFTPNESAIAWWAGVGFELTLFDPLTFAVDAMYGDLHRNETGVADLGESEVGTRGWFVTATLDYKLDWATPGLFGWWSSGDSANAGDTGKYGRMPTLGIDDGYGPTSFGFPGSAGIGSDTAVSATGIGTWGVGIQLAEMSFIEKLEHTLRVAYYRGTNDDELIRNGHQVPNLSFGSVYLTDKDSAFEVNFDHKYQIYENLAAYLELGYIHLDMDSKTWGTNNYKNDDSWKAQVLFQYKF